MHVVVGIIASYLFCLNLSVKAFDDVNIRNETLPDIGKTIPHKQDATSVRDTTVFYSAGKDRLIFTEFIVSHGFTDRWGCRFTLPVAIDIHQFGKSVAGGCDFRAELSYNPYYQPNFLMNLIAGIQFPTGNIGPAQVLSIESWGFLGQLAFVHLSSDWYMGHRTTAIIPFGRREQLVGKGFTIEFGFGKRMIFSPTSSSRFYFIGQFFTLYTEQDRLRGAIVPNTGRSLVFFGPLLSWTHPHGLIEFNFGIPIGQAVHGQQRKVDFRTAFTAELRF